MHPQKVDGYWANHSTISLAKPLIDALKALSNPGERHEDTVRRLIEHAVAEEGESG